MRSIVMAVVAAVLLSVGSVALSAGQDFDLRAEKQLLKQRQKQEMKAMNLAQKYRKDSLKGADVSKAARLQVKHEMQRQKRELREKQKDEAQDLKDRQRTLKESQKAYGSY